MVGEWSRFIRAAAKYAKEGKAGRFIKVKKRIKRRYLVKRVETGARSVFETTVPSGDCCYILHFICVKYVEEESSRVKTIELSDVAGVLINLVLAETGRRLVGGLCSWPLDGEACRVARLIAEAAIEELRALAEEKATWEPVFELIHECRHGRDCSGLMMYVKPAFERLVAEGRIDAELRPDGVIGFVARGRSRKRRVRHAVRLVTPRKKVVKGYEYWVVTARVPGCCRDADKVYVHVFRAPCLDD